MFQAKFMLAVLLSVSALFASAALAAQVSAIEPGANAGIVFHTVLQPDLTFKTTLSPSLTASNTFANPDRPRHGYCRCSCGYPCATSADCGGASCDPFITCCVRGEPGLASPFTSGRSTHEGEEALPSINCK